MFKSVYSVARAAFVGALAFVAAPSLASAQETKKHGDWDVVCGDKGCSMFQNGLDSAGKRVLIIGLTKLATPQKSGERTFVSRMEISAPLGVFLPGGVSVSIDGKKPLRIPFERCLREVCQAGPLVQQPVIDQMKAGNAVTITVFRNRGDKVEIKVSLKGFTAGYDSM